MRKRAKDTVSSLLSMERENVCVSESILISVSLSVMMRLEVTQDKQKHLIPREI